MAKELFEAVQAAENTADALLQEAQRKARELLKDAEAAAVEAERKAAHENRAVYQELMEKKRGEAEDAYRAKLPAIMEQQEQSLQAARGRMDQAAQQIFERIWNDGDR